MHTYIHTYRGHLGESSTCLHDLGQNAFSYHRMCSLTKECILLPQKVFSYYRTCSLTADCVTCLHDLSLLGRAGIERILLLQKVFSYYRRCFLTTDLPP